MNFKLSHRWDVDKNEADKIQDELKNKVIIDLSPEE